ncbi:MAG: FABP family protein [Acidimicrobiia bacterium]|nr:FABP family protein [Acidimicrobiia bacterium]
MAPELHSDVSHLAFLLGTWKGKGRGDYPTIEGFDYFEESIYSHVGKPFLTYSQRTKGVDGLPLHAEVGYLRPVGSDQVELVLAHPFGVTEIQTGSVAGQSMRLATTSVSLTPTAKDIRSLTRSVDVVEAEMTYLIEMAAVDQPLQFHLEARLERQS